ncbi:LLM class F420-dependent oxidoreductase [Nocardia sp. NPDC051030]|uniref:LLM class F420-dependent oxidoreductase n=1 Tax=Nocardia sp. NPDC051030 TaxID=3155162 RepID=UPI003445C8BA
MRISIAVSKFSTPDGAVEELTRVARAADEGGLDTLWVPDHLLQLEPGREPHEAMFEAYTTLGYLAGQTRRIRLGTMVTGATFRPPALLIKAVTTLDALSGGRAWLGIGTGYHQFEADAMALPLPPLPERFERLEETLRLALQMWSGDETPFHGKHFRLDQPICSPLPTTKPHPPILIGGTGEQKTLRLVARYADACNVFDIPDGGATIRHKLEVLARHCETENRPYSEIEKSVSTRLSPTESPASFVDRCGALAELGLDHISVLTADPVTEADIATLATAAAQLRGTGPESATE